MPVTHAVGLVRRERLNTMDLAYILTGLGTVLTAIAGLILTCYLERRELNARRNRPAKTTAVPPAGDRDPVAT